jgi:hypothetical protein
MDITQIGTIDQTALALAAGGSATAGNLATLVQYQIVIVNNYPQFMPPGHIPGWHGVGRGHAHP